MPLCYMQIHKLSKLRGMKTNLTFKGEGFCIHKVYVTEDLFFYCCRTEQYKPEWVLLSARSPTSSMTKIFQRTSVELTSITENWLNIHFGGKEMILGSELEYKETHQHVSLEVSSTLIAFTGGNP